MMNAEIEELYKVVRAAWAVVPAPPAKDLEFMAWGWGDEAARVFTGIAPIDVDIGAHGFFAATPLLNLPPRAAAAYLGTFLLALLKSAETQNTLEFYYDALTRAHIITCLTQPSFWNGPYDQTCRWLANTP